MIENAARRPFFYFSIFLVSGILYSFLILKYNIFNLGIYIMLFIISVILFFIFKLVIAKKKNLKCRLIAVLSIVFFLIGFSLYTFEEYKYHSTINKIELDDNHYFVRGILEKDLSNLEGEYQYIKNLQINDKKYKFLKIAVKDKRLQYAADGSIIFCKLNLYLPNDKLNPGGFSYLRYLKNKNIYLLGAKIQNIKIAEQSMNIKNIIIDLKIYFLEKIDLFFNAQTASFLKAVMFAEKEDLNYDLERLLRESGTGHLLALSGLHIGIIILGLNYFFSKIIEKRLLKLILLTLISALYIILVGGSVSIIRAALLTLIFLWAKHFNRSADFLNLLALTLIINLLINPNELFSAGLQLSYLITLSIYYNTKVFKLILPQAAAVSAAAQAAALPITAYHFGEYAYIALLSNLWVLPFFAFLLPFSFLSLIILIFFPAAEKLLVILIQLGYKFMFSGLKLMSDIQGSSIVIAEPAVMIIVLYYLCYYSLPYIFKKRIIKLKIKKNKKIRFTVLIFTILLTILLFINPTSEFLEIYYLAVGQGDGVYISFPNGKNMIIDTGPPGNNGRLIENTIISFLNFKGIKKIDYVIITHFDSDHSGGLKHLIDRKKVTNLLIPVAGLQKKDHKMIKELKYSHENLKISYISEINKMYLGESKINFLNPSIEKIYNNKNDNSIVFNLNYDNYDFLFTGDISISAEKSLIEKYEINKIDILKAAHHGSSTSSGKKFLSEINPSAAVISVGWNNFGHPSAEVINRFNKMGIKYYRTDKEGAVIVKTDGEKIFVNTFLNSY